LPPRSDSQFHSYQSYPQSTRSTKRKERKKKNYKLVLKFLGHVDGRLSL
jgi:hypothetical protein